MATQAPVELIQKAANICANDMVDELRAIVPVQVPPDSLVCIFFNIPLEITISKIMIFLKTLTYQIKKCFISGFRHAGGTLLHVCSHFGSSQCAAYLLRHGASPNIVDKVQFIFILIDFHLYLFQKC